MQKRLKLIAGLLCLPLLFGCDGRDITTNDGDKFHPMMNLRTTGPFKYDSNHFSGFGEKVSAQNIIDRVNYGEDVLFAFTKEDCSSCESFLKNAGKYIYFSHYRLSYIDEDHKAAAEKISKYAVDNHLDRVLAHPISGGTPSMYIMSKKRIVELVYGSKEGDEKIVTNAFNEYLAETKVYRSELWEWLYMSEKSPSHFRTSISYVLGEESKEDFYSNIYPLLLESKKTICILDMTGSARKYDDDLKTLYRYAGTEDIGGKIFEVSLTYSLNSEGEDEEQMAITIIDDAKSYIETNYASSSL